MYFLLSFELQKDKIKKVCFNKCKKITIGTVRRDALTYFICKEENCPYLNHELRDVPIFKLDGQDCILRSIKEKSNDD